jgi:hypothetical protein
MGWQSASDGWRRAREGRRWRVRPSNTTALQRAIQNAIRTGGEGGSLHIEPDEYLLEDQIYIDGVRNFTVNFEGSLLRAGGAMPDDLELFLLNNCMAVELRGGRMQADVDLLGFIAMQQGPQGTGSKVVAGLDSSKNRIVGMELSGKDRTAFGCRVKLYDYDLSAAIGDVKNDHHRFRDISASGFTYAAFVGEGRNAKDLMFEGCFVQGISGDPSTTELGLTTVTRGVEAFLASDDSLKQYSKGAHLTWIGGQMVNNKCDFESGDHGSGCMVIIGVYSEKSGMALRVPRYGSGQIAPGAITLIGYKWSSGQINADHVVVEDESGGALNSIGCQWGTAQLGRYLQFRKDPTPALAGPFVFQGNFVENDGDGQVFPVQKPDGTEYQNSNYAYRSAVQSRLGTGVIVATDGPNDWKYPASPAQWALLAHAAGTPDSYYTFQGNGTIDDELGTVGLVDVAGAKDLFQLGTVDYEQTLAGWDGYFVKLTETAGESLAIENNAYDPSAGSLAGVVSAKIIASGGNRILLNLANGNTGAGGGGLMIRVLSPGFIEVRANGVGSTGAIDYRGKVVYIAFRWKQSTSTWEAWIRADSAAEVNLSVAAVALVTNGSHKGVGLTGSTSPPESLVRYFALYYGADADLVDGTLLDALGVDASP